MSESPAVEARRLTVRVAGRTLLSEAEFVVRRGEIVLLVGPSGSGKSVLLRLLAGIVDRTTPDHAIEGRLAVLGTDVVANPGASRGRVGLVFQDFALFAGLSAGENVEFALDHRRPPAARGDRRRARDALFAEFALSPEAKIPSMSGGQRQRTAIARALAFAPEILAYDEPTSGLDPAMRDRVAERIRTASRDHGATTIVVTHDVAGLSGIADRVILFDPAAARLVETPVEAAAARLSELEVPPLPPAAPAPAGRRFAAKAADFLAATARTVEGTAAAAAHLIPRWRSPRWGLRFLLVYLRAVAGPSALVYFLLAGAVIGLVATYFTFTFLPWRQYSEPLILDDLVGGLGFGLYRILVPLLATVLLAARAGAAASADVATRAATRQMDAMRTLGAVPERYLFAGVLWAFLLAAPVLALVAFAGAQAASAAVFSVMAPDLSLHAWEGMFNRLLVEEGKLLPPGTGYVVAKYLASAFAIALTAHRRGAEAGAAPEDVARAITKTVIRSTAAVLAIHVAFALYEFD